MANLAMQVYVKALLAKQKFLEEERGAVDIVAIVVLIGIAVALALFFREQISGILTKLFNNISESALGATDPINGSGVG